MTPLPYDPQADTPFPPLAILDWGIGGFGFVRALRQRHPSIAYTYLSDSGYTPYGRVPSARLAGRLSEIGSWLHAHGVRQLVVACYAASTVVKQASWPPGLELFDVLGVARDRALENLVPSFGIVGGRRTILSRSLAGPLRDAGATVVQRVAQPLSAFIERGDLHSPELLRDLDRIVAPLHDVDTLILACTHYPAIAPLFAERLPRAILFDPIPALLDIVDAAGLRQNNLQAPLVLTTGDPAATRQGAAAAFGVDLEVGALQIRAPKFSDGVACGGLPGGAYADGVCSTRRPV
jgi:glutamate racemase